MEAVPRLPMLSIEMKVCPENTEFGSKLKQYIRDFYHEDPESYTNEIHDLEGLRAAAIRVTKDVEGCAILKRYYCQLHFLQSRFPIQEEGAAAVPYYWQDNFSNVTYCTTSINYELASILHNIGALHTQLGASDPRTSAEGMKLSCSHFQCAAWCFQHLKEFLPRPRGTDMAPDFMQLYYQLCLAQAQECILEKSMMDNRKSTIIAKVAAHVVEYYNLALEALTKNSSDSGSIADAVGSKQYKSWQKYLTFKAAYHTCVMLLYQGQSAEEQQKMGERLAFYQAAADKLVEAAKLFKGLGNMNAIADSLQFTQDVVEGKRKAAHNDNEFIYHEKVPERETLTVLKGASLVKGIPFSIDDSEVSGPDIFARLVPLRAHEASSLYSEEKAKLLRRIGTQVDEKDTELAAFMASLQLESLNLHGTSEDELPQVHMTEDAAETVLIGSDLIDACADLSERPESIGELVEAMDKLAETYHDVEGMLQDIDELLKEEEIKEQAWRTTVGVARPPTIAATELTREAGKYREAHAKAGESNQTLHRAMALHVANLRTLSRPLPDLAQQLPRAAGIGAESEVDKAAIAEVTTLVAKVKEMSTQRFMLTNQLREAVLKDDITSQLVTSAAEGGILDVVFDKELSKHSKQVAIIEQNLAAQANILRALTDAYAKYAPARKAATNALRKRQASITALLASYSARDDLLAKAGNGLEFYRKLESSVSRLLARVRSVCRVQEEEREQQQQATAKSTGFVPDNTTRFVPENTTSAPKLKDYLQNLKHITPTANLPHIPNVTASSSSTYYSTHTFPVPPNPAMATTNAPSFPSTTVTTTGSETPQWPTSVRPTPVGSEGNDTSMCSKPSQVPHIQDIMKPNNLPYGANQYPYYQDPSKPIPQPYLSSYSPGYYPTSQAPLTYTNNAQSTPVPQNPQPYTSPAGLLPKVNNVSPQSNNYSIPQQSQMSQKFTNQQQSSQFSDTASTYGINQAVTTTTYSSSYQSPTHVVPKNAAVHDNTPAGYYQQPYINTAMNQAVQQPQSMNYSTSPASTTSTFSTPVSNISGTFDVQNNMYVPNQEVVYKTPTPSYPAQSGQSYPYVQQPHSTPSTLPQASSIIYNQPTYSTPSSALTMKAYAGQPQSFSTPMSLSQSSGQQAAYSTATSGQNNMTCAVHPQSSYIPVSNIPVQTTQSYQAGYSIPSSTQTGYTIPVSNAPTTHGYIVQPPPPVSYSSPASSVPVSSTQNSSTSVPAQTNQVYGQAGYSTTLVPRVPVPQASYLTPAYNAPVPQAGYSSLASNVPVRQAGYSAPASNAPVPQARYSTPVSNVPVSQAGYSTPASNIPVSQTGHSTPGSMPTAQGHVSVTPQTGYSTPASIVPLPQVGYSIPASGVMGQTSQTYSIPAISVPSTQASLYPSQQMSQQGYGMYADSYQASQPQRQLNARVNPAMTQWSGDVYSGSSQSNVSSQYTSAGKMGTQQTNTSQTAVGGQTYAAQYNTSIAAAISSTPSAYYSGPHYGYHYPTTGNMAHAAVPDPGQQQGTPQNVTYIQARMPESLPHTTYCGSPQQAAGDVHDQQSSNIDLLAGLDFNVSQPPLQPQVNSEPIATTSNTSVMQHQTVTPSPVKVVASQPSVTETSTPVSDSTVPVLSIPSQVPIKDSKEEPSVTSSPIRITQPSKEGGKDIYAEPEALNQFVQEVERLEKVVEGLTNKTLNGPTPLDLKWKELQELQEKDAHKRSISVARCYPMKNRFPDILPYDHSRVELPSTKDDYINASYIKDLNSQSPDYILTQAPLSSTYVDFWTMVWEQQTELVVCLLSDTELQGQIYWPTQKGQEMAMGRIRLSLQTVNVKPHWTERVITLVQAETRLQRVIVHLQFTTWPGSSFPASPSGFLSFVSECLSQHAQQRSIRRPVVVHCLSGVGRSGLFCLVSTVMVSIRAGQGLPDLIGVAAIISQQRRGALRDRQHLLFSFQAVLYHCQELLMKRGILTSRSTFDAPLAPRTHARHPSEDFLLGPGSLSQLQSGIEKMGLGAANIDWPLLPPVKPETPPPPVVSPEHPQHVSSLSELASLIPDPASLISGKRHKTRHSKEEFEARRGSLTGSLRSLSPQEDTTNDPLNQLDPLWSLKHQKS